MSENYSRADRLFILANVCKQNNINPDSPTYMGLIIRVATSKLKISIDTAKEYAEALSSAYRADKWETIARKQETAQETEEDTEPKEEVMAPTLNALKNLSIQPSEPVKRIGPKPTIDAEYTPKTLTQRLIDLAKANDFNGVGKLTLAQARHELNDNSLQLKDLIDLLEQYAPAVIVESRPGNLLLLHFPKKKIKVVPATPRME
jgi:hypothetical protein